MASFTNETKSGGDLLWSAVIVPWDLTLPWQYEAVTWTNTSKNSDPSYTNVSSNSASWANVSKS